MADIAEIRELLEADSLVAGGSSEASIEEAEAALGVRFPPSYRAFLSQYGAVGEIAGLFEAGDEDEPPLWSDVVTDTLLTRKVSRGRILNEYIPIAGDGSDFHYYLDTSHTDARGECPMIVLGPGADGLVIADDFCDFVRQYYEDTLSW